MVYRGVIYLPRKESVPPPTWGENKEGKICYYALGGKGEDNLAWREACWKVILNGGKREKRRRGCPVGGGAV